MYLRVIKEEIIDINRDRVYNQTCRLSHDIQVISTFFNVRFDYIFELITKFSIYNNYFEFMN